jgi:hypothetical protein
VGYGSGVSDGSGVGDGFGSGTESSSGSAADNGSGSGSDGNSGSGTADGSGTDSSSGSGAGVGAGSDAGWMIWSAARAASSTACSSWSWSRRHSIAATMASISGIGFDPTNFARPSPTTVVNMDRSHRDQVVDLLAEAAAEHALLLDRVPPAVRASLPVDAQGLTRAIDHLALAAGLSDGDRRALVLSHAVNPAVLHARVFGGAPLTRETVIGAFVEGARVRAEALATLADLIGGESLGAGVRELLVAYPPPLADGPPPEPAAPTSPEPAPPEPASPEPLDSLRATYAAQERAAVLIACALDD